MQMKRNESGANEFEKTCFASRKMEQKGLKYNI